jgi:hypothetical protein
MPLMVSKNCNSNLFSVDFKNQMIWESLQVTSAPLRIYKMKALRILFDLIERRLKFRKEPIARSV